MDTWRSFRAGLGLLLAVVVIPGLWVLQALGRITLPGEVIGASIAVWTLVAQFYFRKSGPSDNGTTPPPDRKSVV